MIQSLKYNSSLRNRSRPFSRIRKEFSKTRKKLNFENKRLNSNELKVIKESIRKRARQERIRNDLFVFISGVLCFIVSFFLIESFFGVQDSWEIDQKRAQKELVRVEDEFQYFINDGETWLKARAYHNAIFQFNKAVELKPEDYRGHYFLMLATMKKCSELLEGCEEANVQLNELLDKFPLRRKATLDSLSRTLVTNGDASRAKEISEKFVLEN